MFEHLTSMLLHFSDIITINSFRPPSRRVITSRHAESSSHCEMPQTSCLDLRETGRERAKNETKRPSYALFIFLNVMDILINWGDLSSISVEKVWSRCILGHLSFSNKSFKGVEDVKDFSEHFGRKLKDFWTSFSKHSQCVQILHLEGSAWGEPVIPVSWQEFCFTEFCYILLELCLNNLPMRQEK